MGRFLQADTIVPNPANPQSLNRYSYTLGNPLRYTDPSGHFDVPTDEEGNLTPTCGELCQLLGFETFDAFAPWWEQLDPHWQNTLRAASWGDMIAFTNTFDNTRIRLIFAKMFGGTPMIPYLRAPGALKNAQLVFWDLDAGCSLHFLVGQDAWTNGMDSQFIRFGSPSHPLEKGQMAIGRSEYLHFDVAYLKAQQQTGWVGIAAFMGALSFITGHPTAGVVAAGQVVWTGLDLMGDLGALVTEVAAPAPGPAYVHQGHPLDRRWQNLSSSHIGY